MAWNGAVSPCVTLLHTHHCLLYGRPRHVRSFHVGNVSQQDLAAIWRSKQFRRFRTGVREFDFSPCPSCGGCSLAEANEEDCFGNEFPTCGGCLWAKGLLVCP